MSVNYSVKGRTKSGVDYIINNSLVSFSSVGINSIHKPEEVNVYTFPDITEPLVSLWIAQTGTPSNGVTVKLNEAEANLFAEALNIAIKRI